MKPQRSLILICFSALIALPMVGREPGEFSPPSRTFLFTYQVTLKDIPAGAERVRIWLPCAVTDANQTALLKKVQGPVQLHVTHDAPSGNHFLYGEMRHPKAGPAQFTVEYEITRREFSRGSYETLVKSIPGSAPPPRDLARYLEPDRLVPIDGKIKSMADDQTRGKHGAVEKARALYDYVFQTVRYDKSGTGWGRGDSLWVCDAHHGNCTDFHSLFISMARAEGIPARFEIGFPVPSGTEGAIPSYHCWAEFFAQGQGWIPVDISEAWQDPKKRDYFFGSLDANRVQFTMGRDLTLQPRQQGQPLNYFIYPYVEVDGKPFSGIEQKFSFREATAAHGNGAAGGR